MRNTRLFTVCGALLALGLVGCAQETDDTLYDGGEAVAPGTTAATTPTTTVPVDPATADVVPTPAANAAAGNLTLVESNEHGQYVADNAGSALYMLEGDRDGSGCTDVCLEAWPPVLVGEAQPRAGAGLQGNLVASIQRPDGRTQITYNGHPLYRYAADRGAGRTAGHGVSDQWGQWHLLTPQGEPLAGASPAP